MKRTVISSQCVNPDTSVPTEVYQNIGRRIRQGIYEGIGDDGGLLRGQYDDPDSSSDPMFQFRHPDVGADKFDRAVLHKKQVDSLHSTSAQSSQMAAPAAPSATIEPAASVAAADN